MADLVVDGLHKRYGEKVALNGTSFEVRPRELFGFVGSNGAGKTTTMRSILGVLEFDEGEIRWDGEPIGREARRRIGYMPEERGLYPRMTVRNQLVYLARLHGLSTADATRAMEQWTERLGIAERADDEVQKLSLGNQQRVQLAAALVHTPDLLVLDEPFSGLDPVAVEVMSSVLREEADRGVPVVFSSHQLDLVERLCDRVGIIKDGSMVAVGTLEELRRSPRPRWRIAGPSDASWVPAERGAALISREDDEFVVEIDGSLSEQEVLAAAMAAGPVTGFHLHQPSLAELYRDVVTESDPAEVAAP